MPEEFRRSRQLRRLDAKVAGLEAKLRTAQDAEDYARIRRAEKKSDYDRSTWAFEATLKEVYADPERALKTWERTEPYLAFWRFKKPVPEELAAKTGTMVKSNFFLNRFLAGKKPFLREPDARRKDALETAKHLPRLRAVLLRARDAYEEARGDFADSKGKSDKIKKSLAKARAARDNLEEEEREKHREREKARYTRQTHARNDEARQDERTADRPDPDRAKPRERARWSFPSPQDLLSALGLNPAAKEESRQRDKERQRDRERGR